MAGNQLHANSQLMYYPTSAFETLRMLGLIGNIEIKGDSYLKRHMLSEIKSRLGEKLYLEIGATSLDNDITMDMALYDYFIQNKQYDYIKQYFTHNITVSGDGANCTIADLQAGEGEWLRVFKDFIPPHKEDNRYVKLIANELEEERYSKIKADYTYLGSFEELQAPQESISLLLFNPPYGKTNGERNVRRYFRMTMERNLMRQGGYILMVIREDDAKDVMDLFCEYFSPCIIYRTHQEEFEKYGQVVILGRKWHNKLDSNTRMGAYDIQKETENYLRMLDNNKEFVLSYYNNKTLSIPSADIETLMENFECVLNDKSAISSNDGVWKHIKELTEIKDISTEKLVLPKMPKQGEIANLLASGQINGTMTIDVDGVKHSHIVVGGVKSVVHTEQIKKDGETTNKTIRYNKPYLNILISKDGEYQIKELGVDT